MQFMNLIWMLDPKKIVFFCSRDINGTIGENFPRIQVRDVPGGLMGKTPCSQYRGLGVIQIPYATTKILSASTKTMCVSCSVMSDSFQFHGLQPARILSTEFYWQEYWSGLPFPYPKTMYSQIKKKNFFEKNTGQIIRLKQY